MNIRINSIHFDASEDLKRLIEKKTSKLEKYYDGILTCEVYLKVVKPETNENKHVEIKIYVPNQELFAEKTADSFEIAIDEVLEALTRQVKKYKEKIKAL